MAKEQKYPAFKTSGYAMLDVTVGRKKLEKWFADRPRLGECPPHLRVPIVLVGYVDDVLSLIHI